MSNAIEKGKSSFGPFEAIVAGIAAVAICAEVASCTEWVCSSVDEVLAG